MVFIQRGLFIGMLNLKTLFSLKVNDLSSWTFSSVNPMKGWGHVFLCPLKLEQVLVLSRSSILELQLIWEWELTTFQRNFSLIQGLRFFFWNLYLALLKTLKLNCYLAVNLRNRNRVPQWIIIFLFGLLLSGMQHLSNTSWAPKLHLLLQHLLQLHFPLSCGRCKLYFWLCELSWYKAILIS